jgi:anti-anti-sigma factor
VAEVELDLAELSYIDPPGLSVLAVEKRRADTSGLAFRITSPTPFVRQMLEITGLIDFLEVTPEGDDASNGQRGGHFAPAGVS